MSKWNERICTMVGAERGEVEADHIVDRLSELGAFDPNGVNGMTWRAWQVLLGRLDTALGLLRADVDRARNCYVSGGNS